MKLETRKTTNLHKLIWTTTKDFGKLANCQERNTFKIAKKTLKEAWKATRLPNKQSKGTWNLGWKWNQDQFLVLGNQKIQESKAKPSTQDTNYELS